MPKRSETKPTLLSNAAPIRPPIAPHRAATSTHFKKAREKSLIVYICFFRLRFIIITHIILALQYGFFKHCRKSVEKHCINTANHRTSSLCGDKSLYYFSSSNDILDLQEAVNNRCSCLLQIAAALVACRQQYALCSKSL